METKLQNISYILQFIDSARFMANSLSNLVNNLSEEIHRIKCQFRHADKKWCGIKYKYCDSFLEYTNFKNDLIEHKCLHCNESYQPEFDEKLKEQFFHTNFLIISLFYYYEKVFILMNIWIIEKNSLKHHYLKKKIFIAT